MDRECVSVQLFYFVFKAVSNDYSFQINLEVYKTLETRLISKILECDTPVAHPLECVSHVLRPYPYRGGSLPAFPSIFSYCCNKKKKAQKSPNKTQETQQILTFENLESIFKFVCCFFQIDESTNCLQL